MSPKQIFVGDDRQEHEQGKETEQHTGKVFFGQVQHGGIEGRGQDGQSEIYQYSLFISGLKQAEREKCAASDGANKRKKPQMAKFTVTTDIQSKSSLDSLNRLLQPTKPLMSA